MILYEKMVRLNYIFRQLIKTNSMTDKKLIIQNFVTDDIKDDFNFCIEVLNGVHKLGYTYECETTSPTQTQFKTVKEVYEYLQTPLNEGNLSRNNILQYVNDTSSYAFFLIPVVNRRWRLGIGRSILPDTGLNAMLAKKYEDRRNMIYNRNNTVHLTEKLDGNRCIAHHDGIKWNFTSRNGKPMNVNFDMSGLPTDRIYDGEIISPLQMQISQNIKRALTNKSYDKIDTSTIFNETSGLINSHKEDKALVYMIFDIMEPEVRYCYRRMFINGLQPDSDKVKILPTLARGENELLDNIDKILEAVVSAGGEGLMINLDNANYEGKRSNNLLKYKPTYTMDMLVYDFEYGTGKNEYCIGALYANAIHDGKSVYTKVGTGLSDEQREAWAANPSLIVGTIIEVAYFSLSQNSDTRDTNEYSLRFPRLKRVRYDKDATSIF